MYRRTYRLPHRLPHKLTYTGENVLANVQTNRLMYEEISECRPPFRSPHLTLPRLASTVQGLGSASHNRPRILHSPLLSFVYRSKETPVTRERDPFGRTGRESLCHSRE